MKKIHSELSVTAYVLCKKPRARDFLDALFSLPEELLPEFWYELEPNPKSKRLYLSKDRERLISETLEFGTFGSFDHKDYALRADYFLPDAGLPHQDSVSFSFYVRPKRKGKSKSVDIRPAMDVFDHFARHLDTYCAYASSYPEEQALSQARALAALSKDKRDCTLAQYEQMLGIVRSYADGKLFFPGLRWRSVLSQECIDDYAIDKDDLRSLSVETKIIPATGSAGDLLDLRFADNPDDWQQYAEQLQIRSVEADEHRCRVDYFLDELHPKGFLSVQNWNNWL
ncbi:hypothetical protein BCF46_3515 [Litoreibacter meonggei]|uniref:Uncharacterized protein n=1 Tax=Litoreibacter meonggei TaxID=1049199 RepID=A0A497VPS2_9RHOB|nr:hypothetical protein [Litoreibacter meonggei]RLJ40944.1 hypothetical protein BCF46_3515 [Litoreibacter meonggei]